MNDGSLVAQGPKETAEEIVEETATRAGAVVVMELLHYFSYLIRVPVVVCTAFIALIALFVLANGHEQLVERVSITIYRLYLLFTTHDAGSLLRNPPAADISVQLDGTRVWQFMIAAYAAVSTVSYVVSLPFRYMFRGRPKLSYRGKFKIFAGASTLSWGAVVSSVFLSPSQPEQSRWGVIAIFFALYLVTLAAYAVALRLNGLADLFVEMGKKHVLAIRNRHN